MIFYENFQHYLQAQAEKLATFQQSNLPDSGVITHVYMSDQNAPDKNQTHNDQLDSDQLNGDQLSKESRFTYLITHPVSTLDIDTQGIIHDRHRGMVRLSSGREGNLYPKRTQIIQRRHLLVVSQADCNALSHQLGVTVTPQLLGANLVIAREDHQDFSMSLLPTNTYLLIARAHEKVPFYPPLATLVTYVQQQGCGTTGKAIADYYGDPSLVKRFRQIAQNHRGMICYVEYPVDHIASLHVGQKVCFKYASGVAP